MSALADHCNDCPTCKAAEFYADEEGYPQAGYCEAGRELHAAHLADQAALGIEARRPRRPAPSDDTPF